MNEVDKEYFAEKLDSDGVWRPKTLEEYSHLAEIDYRVENMDEGLKLDPRRRAAIFDPVYNIYDLERHHHLRGGAGYVLNEVVALIMELRGDKTEFGLSPVGCIAPRIGAFPGQRSPDRLHRKWDKRKTTWTRWEVNHPWVLSVLRLERYMRMLPDSFYGERYCDEYWPKTPFVELFGEVGLAALEIAIDLGWLVWEIGTDAMRRSFHVGEEMALGSFVKKIPVVLEPNLDPRAEQWREVMREAFLARFPSTEWPEERFLKERWKWYKLLNYEAGVAGKAHARAKDRVEMMERMEQILSRLEAARNHAKYPTEIRALLHFYDNPDSSITQIAKAVGVSRQTLYKYPLFMKAWQQEKEGREKSLPRGTKDGETGKMEAWEAP